MKQIMCLLLAAVFITATAFASPPDNHGFAKKENSSYKIYAAEIQTAPDIGIQEVPLISPVNSANITDDQQQIIQPADPCNDQQVCITTTFIPKDAADWSPGVFKDEDNMMTSQKDANLTSQQMPPLIITDFDLTVASTNTGVDLESPLVIQKE